MNVNLKSLVAKLNKTCRASLESAAGLCLSRTNYEVDVEHLLLKLTEAPDTDCGRILAHFDIDAARLERDIIKSLEKLKTGNARTPALSPSLARLFEQAWVIASVESGDDAVRSGHLILALCSDEELGRLTGEISREFSRISVETLRNKLADITSGSGESKQARSASNRVADAAESPAGTRALDQYTVDLTARARDGHIDTVLGRDFEIRQIIDILTRRRQNNPILTGEAGVGKTAVVEGFALRIAKGDVPEPLKNVAVRTLDLGLLQAGAGIKGEFENRLKSVIAEVKASPQPIIVFIDEAHTMIGAGGQAGQNDAANLLKPALARGELRTIAATTWAEYKKYFEKDAALARRFQVVKVEEPTEEQAIIMMRGITEAMEAHHHVRILDEAVADAVRLSHRYLMGRQLPDKSVSVLDTACAKVAIGQGATPPAIEDAQRRIDNLTVETRVLERESATGGNHAERIAEIGSLRASETIRLDSLMSQWARETELVTRIREIHQVLETHATAIQTVAAGQAASTVSKQSANDPISLRSELGTLNQELINVQGEYGLMQPFVTSKAVAEVISGWTGIPVGKMLADELDTVLNLRSRLERRVIGQTHALEAIAQRIQTARANLTDPRRPIGVFLLVGPSGVGKTETAVTLAETLYGGERNLITINMSEYQEAHTVSLLKGSPPGYVGYGEGGVLTEAVRRRPYSVVLLDEIEKAHPDVMELFYQVFDKGMLEDGEGREIDFRNTVILLTSNTATDTIVKLSSDPDTRPEPEGLAEAIRPELIKVFKPALLGRMVVVPYYPISDDVMREIIKLQLERIKRRVAENQRAEFEYDETVITEIGNRCKEVESGARNVDHILTRTLLPNISAEVLPMMVSGRAVTRVYIGVRDGQFTYQIS